jgi:hypothetical protein
VRALQTAASTACALCAIGGALSGCDLSSLTPEHAGSFRVSIPVARFHAVSISADAVMELAVRNVGDRPIPAVTATADPGSAFLVVSVPSGSGTGDAHTYTLGRLGPGKTAVFHWTLRPMRAGAYRITYSVAPSPNATGPATLGDGSPASGALTGRVAEGGSAGY